MAVVTILDAAVQTASFRAASEYEAALRRYHAEHRMRVALKAHFEAFERGIREATNVSVERTGSELENLWLLFSALEGASSDSLDAYFSMRASQRALEAYERLTISAVKRRSASDKDYYQDVAAAARVAAYADGYLSDLLSESIAKGEARYGEATRRSAWLRSFSFVAIATLFLLLAIISVFFSGAVANPIRRLAAAAERIAAGDLDVGDVHASSGDEVEILSDAFNTMTRNLRTMVAGLLEKAELERRLREEERELMETEKALRESQFASLQDQIRPHFLFNALNTIARTALFEDASQTERLTLALSKLFRYSLGNPETLVTVREEVDTLREYLAFQTIRFGERLSWFVHCEKGAEQAIMPRFTLQPLVENAVRHGIEPKEAGGTVSVRVRRRGDRLYISVKDTGVGMDQKLARISLSSSTSGGGLGLSNVQRRISLRYGEGGKMTLKSVPGEGTLVSLSFPAEDQGG